MLALMKNSLTRPFAYAMMTLVALLCIETMTTAAPSSSPSSAKIVVDATPADRTHAGFTLRLAVPDHLDARTAHDVAEGRTGLMLTRIDDDARFVRTEWRPLFDEGLTNGDDAPGEISLHWIDTIRGGETARYGLVPIALGDAAGWLATTWGLQEHPDGGATLLLGDNPIWTAVAGYDAANHEATFKSFDHIYGLEGARLSKGPGGLYSHHRGAFVGWSKTAHNERMDDFWHGKNGAHYRAETLDRKRLGTTSATLGRSAIWVGGDGTPALRDTRSVRVYAPRKNERVFDYTITLEAAGSPVDLDGDPQHAGFQFRAAEEVQDSKATYLRPAGATTTGNDVWENCAWAAARFTVQGSEYVVLHADHPDNPDSVYSTRDYGRFGAFFRARLEPGTPLVVRYRLVVLAGDSARTFDVARGNALSHGFTHPASLRVSP